MKFKDILKELRLEKHLTQAQLAKELNVSLSIVNKWENEKKNPSVDTLILLSKYFKVTVDYLLGLEN
mgnify:CR=1 FL=1